jgi:hypothetical protein
MADPRFRVLQVEIVWPQRAPSLLVMRQRNPSVDFEEIGGRFRITGPERRLRQALTTLLLNAARADEVMKTARQVSK